MLTAEGVGWRYGRGRWVFQEVSVRLRPGEVLRVVGGNGSGKSTLLGLLAGCARPRRGTVRLAGRAAYLPQPGQTLPALPVRQLLALLAEPVPDPVVAAHARTRADQLSSGTARRVLLSAVLAMPAGLLVLDEPAAFLDADGIALVAERVEERRAAGCAVVLADHEQLPVRADHLVDLGGGTGTAGAVRVLLGGTGTLRGRAARDGVLELFVPAADRDKLLLEALQAGWAVLAVQPAEGAT